MIVVTTGGKDLWKLCVPIKDWLILLFFIYTPKVYIKVGNRPCSRGSGLTCSTLNYYNGTV